jgi:hypothetical protein
LVSALKRVDLPTFGRPTMPHFRAMTPVAMKPNARFYVPRQGPDDRRLRPKKGAGSSRRTTAAARSLAGVLL